jgi:hypothetical protein
MNRLRLSVFAAITGTCLTAIVPQTQAQIAVNVGVAPVCPYGYYDLAPYSCAPFGYYGPEWFNGHVFIGAGPWFHGRANFRGYVNNAFHPGYGYRGPMPRPGERANPANRFDGAHFAGNEQRDGRGHAVGRGH